MMTEEDLIAQLQEQGEGKLWEDPDFPADSSALYRSKYAVAPYDKGVFDEISWLRPHEFVADPDYFKDLNRIGDVVEARGLDDSWFLGALAMVASHPDALLENVLGSPPEGIHKYGLFTARFCKNGEWKDVVTDTRLPCAVAPEDPPGLKFPRTPVPLYGRCLNLHEQWVSLLEKAYAKLHGSYEALHTGSASEAIGDLTGGAVHKIYLNEPAGKALVDSGALWETLRRYRSQGCILGASNLYPGAAPHEETFFGLLKNRVYPIIDLREVYGFKLVRVRNPYERGAWKGDWANDSRMWSEYPEVLAKIRTDPSIRWVRSDTGDGTTWMSFSDLTAEFNKLYVAHIFPNEKFKQYMARGEWVGKTAGGAHKGYESVSAADILTVGSSQGTANNVAEDNVHRCLRRMGDTVLPDGDAYWFNNPQFRLTVTQKTEVFVSLMQQDRRGALALRENHPVSFEVIRQRKDPSHFRVWDYDPNLALTRSTPYKFAQREVVVENLELEPGFSYTVIPHGQRHAREGKFVLRVFTKEPVLFERVPDTFSTYLGGAWDRGLERDSTGGPLLLAEGSGVKDNYKWCQNPQYWVRVPEIPERTVDLKLVLRRIDKHREAKNRKASRDQPPEIEHYVGLVVCRVPVESAEGKAKAAQRNNKRRENKSPTREAKLKFSLTKTKRDKGAAAEGDVAHMIQRKLYIRKDEWVRVSDYSSAEEASMTLLRLDPQWIPKGLLVVPTLSDRNTRGTFSLEVHSDTPGVTVQELLESKTKTLTGAWDSETAGGSHLHPDWRKNPKFLLKLNSSEEVQVAITLSRAEKEWRQECAKDPLGAMVGFYIFIGHKPTRDPGMIEHDGRPWTESAFVPMHEVSTPAHFTLPPLPEDEAYTLMPCTFEPGKKGGFFLSVVTDADFVLRKDAGPATTRHQR